MVFGRVQNRNSSVQWWVRLGFLVTGLVMMVLSFAGVSPAATAQGGINLTVNGSAGPITVPVNTNLPIVATGLTPLGTFTYAAYQGGDCGLGLVAVQDLEADAAGVWNWSSLSSSTPTTLRIRVSDGPNISNCVQITWEAVQPTQIPPTSVPPTEVPPTNVPPTEVPSTATPTVTTTPDPTATVTATATVTTTPDPTATATVTVTPTTEPTGTATVEPTQTPTEIVTTTPDPTGTATSTTAPTHAPTKVPTHVATATATSPVSMLPSTGGDAGTGSPLLPGMLLGSGALLLLMAASQVKRSSTGRRR